MLISIVNYLISRYTTASTRTQFKCIFLTYITIFQANLIARAKISHS